MNEKFLALLSNSGWFPVVEESGRQPKDTFTKAYTIDVNNAQMLVQVWANFYQINTKLCPTRATFYAINKPELKASYVNRHVTLVGDGKIICLLDTAGYTAALKYVLHGFKVNHFKSAAKAKLYNAVAH